LRRSGLMAGALCGAGQGQGLGKRSWGRRWNASSNSVRTASRSPHPPGREKPCVTFDGPGQTIRGLHTRMAEGGSPWFLARGPAFPTLRQQHAFPGAESFSPKFIGWISHLTVGRSNCALGALNSGGCAPNGRVRLGRPLCSKGRAGDGREAWGIAGWGGPGFRQADRVEVARIGRGMSGGPGRGSNHGRVCNGPRSVKRGEPRGEHLDIWWTRHGLVRRNGSFHNGQVGAFSGFGVRVYDMGGWVAESLWKTSMDRPKPRFMFLWKRPTPQNYVQSRASGEIQQYATGSPLGGRDRKQGPKSDDFSLLGGACP